MDERLQEETRRLIGSWMRYDADMLRDYLVRGVENPRINVQSIFTRHFLLTLLFPGRFARLCEQEMIFAVAMNWLLRQARAPEPARRLDAIHGALLDRVKVSHGPAVPEYLAAAFAALPGQVEDHPIPNYIDDFLARRGSLADDAL